LYLFNINQAIGKKFNLKKFNIAPDSALVTFKNDVFITGGKGPQNTQLKLSYYLNL